MQGFKCKVTGASPTARTLAKSKAPVFCENEPEKCVKGPKQMLAWQQAEGNNIATRQGVTPNYNMKCGWKEGAQTDIFEEPETPEPSSPSSTSLVNSTVSVDESSRTLATSATSVAVTPTPVKESVSGSLVLDGSAVVSAVPSSKTECMVRRPRYTPHHYGRPQV